MKDDCSMFPHVRDREECLREAWITGISFISFSVSMVVMRRVPARVFPLERG